MSICRISKGKLRIPIPHFSFNIFPSRSVPEEIVSLTQPAIVISFQTICTPPKLVDIIRRAVYGLQVCFLLQLSSPLTINVDSNEWHITSTFRSLKEATECSSGRTIHDNGCWNRAEGTSQSIRSCCA
ncbi:hypothetical protein Tcan_01647 [Toxocara canis]|uniref:Uncharacterized protein n=1 Tax=Toxocara canis TaxID=6265 RepID=A0A0B2W1U0_TOXCA|nr:hypothetical protein Tcan_01647 [Toxocara canis]